MSRTKILVTGANGTLGRAVLHELGPDIAIAATRYTQSPVPSFQHAELNFDGTPPAAMLAQCSAVINAAGNVSGDKKLLNEANVRLPLAIANAAKAAGVPKFVHVSSFAVVGTAEHIDAMTPDAPINAYGRSKAEGELELRSDADGAMSIEILRLPLMFSSAKPGLLSPLLELATKLRVLPSVVDRPVRRSMLTYASAARLLVECAASDRRGIGYAADPLPFDYELLASILWDESSLRVGMIPLPRFAAAAANIILPGIGRRLFRSSLLSPQANLAGTKALDIEKELRAAVKAYRRK